MILLRMLLALIFDWFRLGVFPSHTDEEFAEGMREYERHCQGLYGETIARM